MNKPLTMRDAKKLYRNEKKEGHSPQSLRWLARKYFGGPSLEQRSVGKLKKILNSGR